MKISVFSGLCLLVSIQANPLFEFTPEARKAIQADKAYAQFMTVAEQTLKVKPLSPEELAPSGRNLNLGAAIICHQVGRSLSDWMHSLGLAFQISQEEKYARHGVELLVEMCKRFPIEQHWMSAPGTMAGGRGDMMRGLALGYGLLLSQMTQEQRTMVAKVAEGYLLHFLEEAENPKTWWKNVHNFNGVCGGAAGLITIAFDDYPDIVRHRDHCADILERWFDASIDEEGAYAEGAGYSQYGLSNSLLFAWLLKERGGRDMFKHPKILKLSQFYAASMLPGMRIMEARNDSGYSPVGFECLLLAVFNNDGLAAWLWGGAGNRNFPLNKLLEARLPQAVPPEDAVRKDILFPGRGLCVWRTGWGKEDVMFSTEAGHYYHVTHNQSDKGHFSLYAFGEIWAGDPGYGNDSQFPDSRCHTLAHSCVLIDGKGQARSGCGTGTNGSIRDFMGDERIGYALADATEAYQHNYYNQPGAGARKAWRHNLFVKPFQGAPAYAAVFDDIEKDDDTHDFTWQMVTWVDKTFIPRKDGSLVRVNKPACGKFYAITPANSMTGSCEWEFETKESGTWRVIACTSARGDILDKSDSFCVQIDDSKIQHYHMPSNRSWQYGEVRNGVGTVEPFHIELAPGKHVLRFMTREPEAAVASVFLTQDMDIKIQDPQFAEKVPFKFFADDARITGGMKLLPMDDLAGCNDALLVKLSAEAALKTPEVDVYAPDDSRHPAALQRLRANLHAVNPHFAALLIPLREGMAEPEITEQRNGKALEWRIRWKGHTDTITWDGVSRPELKR